MDRDWDRVTGQMRDQAAGSSLCDREQHVDELNTNGELDLVPSWGHRCWLLPSPSEVTVLPEREQNDTCPSPEVTPQWPEARHVLPGECPGTRPHLSWGGCPRPSLSQEPLSQVGFCRLDSLGPSSLGHVEPQDTVSSALFQQTLQRHQFAKERKRITDGSFI